MRGYGDEIARRRVAVRAFESAALGVVATIIVGVAGCSRLPPEATPDGAVRLFLDDMDVAGDDPRAIRRAYGLLGPAARANLTERARHTSELQGRHVEPPDMLAEGFFGLSFRPKAMRPTVVGDRATVEVFGEDPQGEHASVVCVREDGSWHVEPGLPEP